MKILSLQSIGLGATFSNSYGNGINVPFILKVGYPLYDGIDFNLKDKNGNEITVTKIEFERLYADIDVLNQSDSYFVHTSDGHIRLFPADKYIAEWGE
ncbi:hypothetical protein [Leuconostoc gasicomitatum]|uniref:hypothetical protein n=1 Tax=Leuconostoc gasicomitatum TaxID=115778 RepID=UPI0007E1046B|nr:hypothetical protein [Leuconostoc gasicomitatum]CUW06721.1 hypothetical protein PB1E_0741 [Leuconostoc gasicomitatum]